MGFINKSKKTCLSPGCTWPIFSHKYCKSHQYLRTDSKKPTQIKKISEKGIIKKEAKKEQLDEDMIFYLDVWEKKLPHECYNCGKQLGQPLLLYFDHILEKGNEKYARLRHAINNICYLCWSCHSDKTNGILSDKLKALREATLKLYFGSDEK